MFKLRPYQEEAIRAVQRDWADGLTDVLVTAATGTGKTETFLALLAEELGRDQKARALILCHRRELIEQPLERLWLRFPEMALQSGMVMADRNETDKRIIAATVQTLADPGRVDAILRHGAIGYLVRDEAHRAVTPTDMAILERLRFANPQMKHLGVTATPIRADGKGLKVVYQKESYHYGIREAVKGGALVPPRWLAIQTGISLANVSQHDGDYSNSGLADVFETANCFDLVVESHRKYADGRQAMAFTPSVAGAYDLARRFTEAGYPAGAADGTTARNDRAGVLRDFRAGRLSVLVNCMLWTEGIDVPNVSCIHQVRPTRSDGAYVQMIGRGLRTAPGKSDCVAEGQRVLTDRGLVPIERVTLGMKVWDGVEFVSHQGAICKGEQEVITYAGLTATPDHKVWTRRGWMRIGECAANGTDIVVTGSGWKVVRESDGYQRGAAASRETHLSAHQVHAMRDGAMAGAEQSAQGPCWVPQMWASKSKREGSSSRSQVALSESAGSAAAVRESDRGIISSIWGAGDRVPLRVSESYGSLGAGESWVTSRHGDRSHQQQRALRGGELALGDRGAEPCQQPQVEGQRRVSRFQDGASRDSLCRLNLAASSPRGDDTRTDHRAVSSPVVQAKRRVWDILNAGPRHRFTAEGLLVSNCLILDYSPQEARNIVMLGDVLGVDARKDVYIEEKPVGEVMGGFTYDGNVKWLTGNPMELISRELDYLDLNPFAWHRADGWLTLGLGEGSDGIERSLAIQIAGEQCVLWGVAKREGATSVVARLGDGAFETISDEADDLISKHANAILAAKSKQWRKQPASEAQQRFAQKLGVWRDGGSKGDIAAAITHRLTIREIEKGMRHGNVLVREAMPTSGCAA